jgi:hypothetical protein
MPEPPAGRPDRRARPAARRDHRRRGGTRAGRRRPGRTRAPGPPGPAAPPAAACRVDPAARPRPGSHPNRQRHQPGAAVTGCQNPGLEITDERADHYLGPPCHLPPHTQVHVMSMASRHGGVYWCPSSRSRAGTAPAAKAVIVAPAGPAANHRARTRQHRLRPGATNSRRTPTGLAPRCPQAPSRLTRHW